ncbi:MAG: hypothetical protein R3F62_17130 [Planctomycetota bacterium]
MTWSVLVLVGLGVGFVLLLALYPLLRVGRQLLGLGDALQAARRAAEERAQPAPGGIQVKGSTKSEHCPYCRDALDEAPVACAECLARHHLECWDEHRQCASCGHLERFGQVERTAGRDRPPEGDKAQDQA